MTYQLVYDIETAWPSPIAIVFFVVGLIVTITLLILLRRNPVPDSGIPSGKVVLPFLAVVTGFTFVALGMLDGGRSNLKREVDQTGCERLEGTVTDFSPLGGGKGRRESFRLNGAYFEYSDFSQTGAFNNSARHGGPIKPDLPIRLCYVASERLKENLIVRLEVGTRRELYVVDPAN